MAKYGCGLDDGPAYVPDGGFGAQVAAYDLDQDGTPEIVTTINGEGDAIVVHSWSGGTTEPTPRLRLPAPGGVRALAVCPAEVGGEPVLVAVVGNEVWLVRAEMTPVGAPER